MALVVVGSTGSVFTANVPTDPAVNCTPLLQKILDNAPSGSTIKFRDERIRSDNKLSVPSNLTLEGPSAANPVTFYSALTGIDTGEIGGGISQRQHISMVGRTNVTLRNIKVEGPNTYRLGNGYTDILTLYEAEHGFQISGGSNITLENCQAVNIYGDGVCFNDNGVGVADGVVITGFQGRFCGRHAIGLIMGRNITITNLVCEKVGREAIDFEPNSAIDEVNNVTVTGGSGSTGRSAFTSTGTWGCDNITIDGFTWTGAGQSTAQLVAVGPTGNGGTERASNWQILNCVQNPGFGLEGDAWLTLTRVDGAKINGNTALWIGGQEGVKLTDCAVGAYAAIEVKNNTFWEASVVMSKNNGVVVDTTGSTNPHS